MNKILSYTLIFLLFLNLIPVYAQAEQTASSHIESRTRSNMEKVLLKELIYRYRFYNLFLKKSHLEKGFIISNHGENREDILKYLKQGFSQELALQIINDITAYQPEIKKQVIIPKEGLPLITEEDLPYIRYEIKDDEILFIRTYQVDYPYDAQIIYKIHTRFTCEGLKICQLELEERKIKVETENCL